ncbi:ARID DNA-binding domain-containing protein, partial [Tanacetum coccineum]
SQGTENGMKPIHKHDQGGVNRGYLLRETPQRLLSWNNRKKSLSPGCKEMLLEKMKEIEAFNALRVSAKATNQGKGSASTQKEKKARCYICKIRGHVFWKCPNKKKKIRNGDKSQIDCYKCGKLGHYAYECANKKKEEVAALLVETYDELLIDEN